MIMASTEISAARGFCEKSIGSAASTFALAASGGGRTGASPSTSGAMGFKACPDDDDAAAAPPPPPPPPLPFSACFCSSSLPSTAAAAAGLATALGGDTSATAALLSPARF